MATTRNSTLEGLRIIAMIAIVGHHYAVHGGVMETTGDAGTEIFLTVFSGFGKWGVDLFVLVGAYFFTTRPARGKALASIYAQVLPVSWLILAAALLWPTMQVSRNDVREGLLPVIFGEYWFVTVYVMLMLVGPYLAMLARALTRVQLLRLITAGTILWSVLTLLDRVWLGYSNFGWFMLVFMVAAYVRLHAIPGSARAWAFVAAGTGALMVSALVLVSWLRWSALGRPDALDWVRDYLAEQNSPLALGFAAAVLIAAVKARVTASRVVNYWATAAFGVYLIHDNPLVRRVLWDDLADTQATVREWWLPLHAIGWTLGVYVACSLAIFVLQPTVLRPALRATTAIRLRIERRLERTNAGTES